MQRQYMQAKHLYTRNNNSINDNNTPTSMCTAHMYPHLLKKKTHVLLQRAKGCQLNSPSRPVWGCTCMKAMTNMGELEMKIQRETVDENQFKSHRSQRRTPASGCVILRAILIWLLWWARLFLPLSVQCLCPSAPQPLSPLNIPGPSPSTLLPLCPSGL